jgi:hypothetical protein
MMVVSKRRIIGSIRPMLVMVAWRQWPRRPDSPTSLFQKGTQIARVQPSGDGKRREEEGRRRSSANVDECQRGPMGIFWRTEGSGAKWPKGMRKREEHLTVGN